MQYRRLGGTDLSVSVVAAGGYPFGPPLLGREETAAVVRRAVACGVNLFDTSDVYGEGRSEEFLGDALVGVRDEVCIATKFNLRNLDGRTPRERIYARCEEALRKLRTDRIDLFQVHFATPGVPHEELLGPLSDLVGEGKVRWIGNCNTAAWRWRDEIAVSRAQGMAEFESTQNHYSLLHRHAELELLPFCAAYGKSLLAYFPLGGGWLTGTYRPGQPYPEGSRAAKVPTGIVTRLRSERVERLVPRLEAFAAERGHTVAELALAWVVAHPEVAAALTGFDRPEHVDANVKAADWTLSADDLSELDAITSWWEGRNAAIDSDGPTPRPEAPAQ